MADRYIIAFDPGVTTGVAWTGFRGDIIGEQVENGAIGIHEYLKDQFDNYGLPEAIVYEKFFYQQRDKVVLTPVEVIGVLRVMAYLNDIKFQGLSASQAKGFWTDKKLKKAGVYEVGMKHANDAIRHLLYYLSFGSEPDHTWINRLRSTNGE